MEVVREKKRQRDEWTDRTTNFTELPHYTQVQ